MGWRDRDYAKWTDDERRLFYGTGATYTSRHPTPRIRRGHLLRPGAGLAALASLAIALGQLPLHHPLLPAFHIGPLRSAATINLPPTATVGSGLSLHGTAPSGAVTVEGSYDGGKTWVVLSSIESLDGTYSAQVTLSQQGDLSIKILFADGSTANGSIAVR